MLRDRFSVVDEGEEVYCWAAADALTATDDAMAPCCGERIVLLPLAAKDMGSAFLRGRPRVRCGLLFTVCGIGFSWFEPSESSELPELAGSSKAKLRPTAFSMASARGEPRERRYDVIGLWALFEKELFKL